MSIMIVLSRVLYLVGFNPVIRRFFQVPFDINFKQIANFLINF